ncbi:unnamed protein product [Paramecium sonneborni]|uniref:Uncharacterized protein n=1 Tax=Paramecium sonneborni TaxID=65129 RepID=A0A8S1NN41_9CILI|nr:unnamed protein product [Paramecium sonneborni]
MATGKINNKIGQAAQSIDVYDQMLAEYEKPSNSQGAQQQKLMRNPQQQASSNNQKGAIDLVTLENQYTVPSKLQSMSVLKFDIGYINQNILPNFKKNLEMTNFYKNLVSEMQKQLSTIIQNIKDEKIKEGQYINMVSKTFQEEQNKFKVATSAMKNRLGMRCKTLNKELEDLKNKQFDKICQTFGCGPDLTQKFLFEEFQEKPYKEKAKELLIRHKEYLNLTQYLSTHMKEEKRELIEFLIEKLEKSKAIQNDLKEGKNIDFSKFYISEFKEITEEQFLGMPNVEFQAKITNMIDQVNQASKEEQLYYKVASLAKPIIQVIPGTKQMQKVNPSDICKQYFARYEELQKYLQDQKNARWTPLPIFKLESENREISTVNKDVPNGSLRIQFKNFVNGDKLFLQYELTIGNQVYQGKTEQADGSGKLGYVQDINLKEFKNGAKEIHLSVIDIKAFKKGWLSNDLKGQGKIQLNDLLDMSTIERDLLLNDKTVLQYCIMLRESINKKKTVTTAQIVKTYPKFDKRNGLDQYLEQKLKEIPNEPVLQKQQKQEIQQPQQQQQPQQKQIEQEQQEEEEACQGPQLQPDQLILLNHQDTDEEYLNVKKFAEKMPQLQEELLNPENPLRGGIYYFLVQYTPFLQNKSVELRQDPSQKIQQRFVQKLWEDCLRQQNRLKNKLMNDMEGYFTDLQKIIKKDQLMIKLYKQAQAPSWSKFVEGRLEIALQEEKAIQEQS